MQTSLRILPTVFSLFLLLACSKLKENPESQQLFQIATPTCQGALGNFTAKLKLDKESGRFFLEVIPNADNPTNTFFVGLYNKVSLQTSVPNSLPVDMVGDQSLPIELSIEQITRYNSVAILGELAANFLESTASTCSLYDSIADLTLLPGLEDLVVGKGWACDGSLGRFDIGVEIANGEVNFIIDILQTDLPPETLIQVGLVNSTTSAFKVFPVIPAAGSFQIKITTADLKNYDLVAIRTYSGGLFSDWSNVTQDATCYIPGILNGQN